MKPILATPAAGVPIREPSAGLRIEGWNITSLAVDAEGDLWIGTEAGVIRRDSSTGALTAMTVADGLLANGVTSVAIDSADNKWFGTHAGVSRMGADGTWTSFAAPDDFPLGDVIRLAVDRHDNVWAGSGGALARWTSGRWQAYPVPGNVVMPPDTGTPPLVSLAVDSQGNAWTATVDQLLRVSPGGDWTSFAVEVEPGVPLGLGEFGVLQIGVDVEDGVWAQVVQTTRAGPYHELVASTHLGLGRMAPDGSWRIVANPGPAEVGANVLAMAMEANGDRWFGWDTRLSRITAGGDWITELEAPGDTIQHLAAGPNGELWMVADGKLSRRAPDASWTTLPTDLDAMPARDVTAIAADEQGGLWVLTDHVGRRAADGRWTTYRLPEPDVLPPDAYARPQINDVSAVAPEPGGGVWFAGYGLNHAAPGGMREHFTHLDGLVSDYVQAIAVDAAGNVWIGTPVGVSRLAPDRTFRTYTKADGLVENDVSGIVATRDGALWFASRAGFDTESSRAVGGGLTRLLPDGRWTTYTVEDGLPSNNVTAIAAAGTDSLWVATWPKPEADAASGQPGGVALWHPREKSQLFSSVDGLASDYVLDVSADSDGTVWFATREGVSRRSANGHWTTFARHSLPADRRHATSLAADGNGGVWVSMGSNVGDPSGALHLDGDGVWSRHGPVLGDTLLSEGLNITAGLYGDTWFGGFGTLRRRTAAGRWSVYPPVGATRPQRMAASPDGGLWLTGSGGLSRLTPEGRWLAYGSGDGLHSDELREIEADARGGLWVAASLWDAERGRRAEGAMRRSPDGAWTKLAPPNWSALGWLSGIATQSRRSLWGHADIDAWLVTYDSVHRRSADGTWTAFNHYLGLRGGRGVVVDSDGTVWLPNSHGLRSIAQDGTFASYPVADERSSDETVTAAVDGAGNLWFAMAPIRPPPGESGEQHGGGVRRLAPDGTWTFFGPENGLPSDYIRTIVADTGGNMWFLGYEGLLAMLPAAAPQP